ncbi:MAG: endonuclease/exonuclease/phosphatase family protein [Pseudomonadota bacterium]
MRDVTEMKWVGWFFGVCAMCMALAVFAGFAGGLHPAFDTLALARPALALLCLLALVLPMGRHRRLSLALAAIVGLGSTIPLMLGGGADGNLRVYSKNLWFANASVDAVAADIRDSGADLVLLQEVSSRNRMLLAAVSEVYPHQHVCQFSGWSGLAVLARVPIMETDCTARRGAAAALIASDAGPVWAVSVHLAWPFPYSNAQTGDAVSDLVAGLEGPVVLGGDFNIFPWAGSVRQIQSAADLQVARPVRPTFDSRGVPLLLDHVHAPGGGTASYRPLLGSDHLGVLADVWVTAPSGPDHAGTSSGSRTRLR